MLAIEVQAAAAGDQHGEVGAGGKQAGHQGRRLQDVLEVVEDEQDQLVIEERGQALGQRRAAGVREADGLGNGGSDQRRIGDRGQGDEPDPVRERIGDDRGGRDGEPGLAGAAGTGQCQQADVGLAEQGRDGRDFRLPPHQRRERRGEAGAGRFALSHGLRRVRLVGGGRLGHGSVLAVKIRARPGMIGQLWQCGKRGTRVVFPSFLSDACHTMDERAVVRTESGQHAATPDTMLSGIRSAREAAVLLGLNERTIRRAIARGELAATRLGRSYHMSADALERYARQRERQHPPPTPAVPLLHLVERVQGPAFSLPHSLTSFLGREREVAIVAALLNRPEVRLLTLTGPGGAGKTRLALRVAEESAAHFADGVAFVPLAAVVRPELVLQSIAQALGVREGGERPLLDRLVAALRERRSLLVLDNYEHVRPAAPLVTTMLLGCPDLTVLVTSRTTLHLSGEHTFPVPPLTLPEAAGPGTAAVANHYEAVQLFVARAQAIQPEFILSDDNAGAIAEICQRLDGLPLAIELAAARSSVLSPEAMLARLQGRLPFLIGGPQDVPPRLRTMRDAIAWSYDLLRPNEQRLFSRLAVFAGGFTLGAAIVAAGAADPERDAVLDAVATLVDASLVRQTGGRGEPRYEMLETIREYGRERLVAMGVEEETRHAHLAWVLEFVETIWPPRTAAPTAFPALGELDRERANIRAALAWAIARADAAGALRLTSALAEYWQLRGDFTEGRDWLRQALHLGDGPPQLRASAQYGAAILADSQGDLTPPLRSVRRVSPWRGRTETFWMSYAPGSL